MFITPRLEASQVVPQRKLTNPTAMYEDQPAGAADVADDVGTHDEDARSDHRSGDDHGRVEQTEAGLEGVGVGHVVGLWIKKGSPGGTRTSKI